jgi:hypothetical protein
MNVLKRLVPIFFRIFCDVKVSVQRAQAWPGGSEGGDPFRDLGACRPVLRAHSRMIG